MAESHTGSITHPGEDDVYRVYLLAHTTQPGLSILRNQLARRKRRYGMEPGGHSLSVLADKSGTITFRHSCLIPKGVMT